MIDTMNTPKPEYDRITLRAFRAVEDPETSALFAEEHTKVLSDIGIGQVTKVSKRWQQDPNVYVIAAEHDELGLVGGIRIHVSRTTNEPLPLLFAVGKMDPALETFVEPKTAGGIAEDRGVVECSPVREPRTPDVARDCRRITRIPAESRYPDRRIGAIHPPLRHQIGP